ncbi:MAG: RNA methyltransferase [Proteobacteria bacterium]|nr:RNA methyltransferase [Pseudomonadota bacterium]
MVTVYGRKAVLEVLQDKNLQCHALHLADSNVEKGIIAQIRALAEARGIAINIHSRVELSRISKSGKQDQGVAADILCPSFNTLEQYLLSLPESPCVRLLALDGISNPQNLGMILRSAAAGKIDGIIWSRRGNAALGPLVIKASAGTLYRAPLLLCQDLAEALTQCKRAGMDICTLEASAPSTLFGYRSESSIVYVLGNETQGVSRAVSALADTALSIPMRNGVESLNVAVTASLIAFAGDLGD